jgi:hypothetical protein
MQSLIQDKKICRALIEFEADDPKNTFKISILAVDDQEEIFIKNVIKQNLHGITEKGVF